MLRRAAVFAGDFTLEAAEAVGAGPGVEAGEVLDLVGRLVAKSLVQAETRGGAARYRLLETLRLYGRERLVAAGEAAAARDRHLAWCLRLVGGVPETTGGGAGAGSAAVGGALPITGDVDTEARLAGEHDNLRAALEWARDGDAPAGLRLAVGLGFAWALTHLLPDPGGWLDGLLARAPGPGGLRAWALVLAATVHRMCGALAPARGHLQEARALFEQTGDRYGLARVDGQDGLLAVGEGDRGRARACLEASLAALRDLGDPHTAVVLRNLGLTAIGQGDLARARAALEESAALVRARGTWSTSLGMATARLGVVARLEGDHPQARALFEECLARTPDALNVGPVALGGLGDLARDGGEVAQARAYYARLAARAGEVAASLSGPYLSRMGILAVRQGAPARGARLLGAVSPAAVVHLRMHFPDVEADHEAAGAAARAALGEAAFAAAWAEGQAMSLDEATAYALEDTPAAT